MRKCYNDIGDKMYKDIKIEDIQEYQKSYKNNILNKDIEEGISKYGMYKFCSNKDLINNINYDFNIEIPEAEICNQWNSNQCSIFAFLRVMKSIISIDNNMDCKNMDLSASYINFYDKLEKINSLYNVLLVEENLTLDIIHNKVNNYVGSYSTFHFCRNIINKYGFVETKDMNNINDNYNENLIIELLRDKIKSDSLVLLNSESNDKGKIKKQLMQAAYDFLSKVIGNPPTLIEFNNETLTPLELKNKLIGDKLNSYVTVTSHKKNDLLQSYSYIPNVYLSDNEEIIQLNLKDIKIAIIRQLKDNIGIWFSSEESKTLDYDFNILDDNIYNFSKILSINKISKDKALILDSINYDHAMCITGVLVLDNKIKQFKVDNSFGEHGKYSGYLIMTESFFDNCVITVILDKKYLD